MWSCNGILIYFGIAYGIFNEILLIFIITFVFGVVILEGVKINIGII